MPPANYQHLSKSSLLQYWVTQLLWALVPATYKTWVSASSLQGPLKVALCRLRWGSEGLADVWYICKGRTLQRLASSAKPGYKGHFIPYQRYLLQSFISPTRHRTHSSRGRYSFFPHSTLTLLCLGTQIWLFLPQMKWPVCIWGLTCSRWVGASLPRQSASNWAGVLRCIPKGLNVVMSSFLMFSEVTVKGLMLPW